MSQQLCYVASGNEVFKLDLGTCTNEFIGITDSALTDLAMTPSGELYGIDFYHFYKVSTANGSLTPISVIGMYNLGFNSLVGYNDDYVLAVKNTSGLYKIHTTTGDTTLIGTLGYYPAGDITFYKGFYYMADVLNRLIRFELDFENNSISAIEVVGVMNTPGNAIFGIVTIGEANCDKNEIQLIAFGGTTIYSVDPTNATCSTLCPASSNIGASGAASPVETQEQFPDVQLQIPNIFTPNHDEINDYFEPALLIGVRSVQIEIINRWGNVIYSGKPGETFSWDGHTAENELCPDGMYFYKLIYTDYCDTKETMTGFIQLIR